MPTKPKHSKPYIVCVGANGRAVVFGYSPLEPEHGKPIRLTDARMILKWTGNGLFGVATDGPRKGSELTAAVAVTETSDVQQWLSVSDAAAKVIKEWPAK